MTPKFLYCRRLGWAGPWAWKACLPTVPASSHTHVIDNAVVDFDGQ